MCHISFLHPSLDGCLDCLHSLGTENNIAVDMGVWLFLGTPTFNFFKYLATQRVAANRRKRKTKLFFFFIFKSRIYEEALGGARDVHL